MYGGRRRAATWGAMIGDMGHDGDLRSTFGTAASLYQSARPDYPDDLYRDLLAGTWRTGPFQPSRGRMRLRQGNAATGNKGISDHRDGAGCRAGKRGSSKSAIVLERSGHNGALRGVATGQTALLRACLRGDRVALGGSPCAVPEGCGDARTRRPSRRMGRQPFLSDGLRPATFGRIAIRQTAILPYSTRSRAISPWSQRSASISTRRSAACSPPDRTDS